MSLTTCLDREGHSSILRKAESSVSHACRHHDVLHLLSPYNRLLEDLRERVHDGRTLRAASKDRAYQVGTRAMLDGSTIIETQCSRAFYAIARSGKSPGSYLFPVWWHAAPENSDACTRELVNLARKSHCRVQVMQLAGLLTGAITTHTIGPCCLRPNRRRCCKNSSGARGQRRPCACSSTACAAIHRTSSSSNGGNCGSQTWRNTPLTSRLRDMPVDSGARAHGIAAKRIKSVCFPMHAYSQPYMSGVLTIASPHKAT